ncbi:hypothetical protein EDD85DRAFT_942340 [Armillaria nabsnona]|nr:hypothetical protein EDD85DRAFT_942340 [Armillaria nabsnona]
MLLGGEKCKMALQDLAATYHPGFDTPDADALSSSLDGMVFRLPSSVLLQFAAFFISSTLTFLPNGKPIPINRTRLRPSETWGWKGAFDIVRASIAAPAFIRELIPVNALGTRFVWEDKAKFASKHVLEGMEWDVRCTGCLVDGSAWTALVWKMLSEMDAKPLCLCSVPDRRVAQMDACWKKYPRCRSMLAGGVEGTSDAFHDTRVYLSTHLIPTSTKVYNEILTLLCLRLVNII